MDDVVGWGATRFTNLVALQSLLAYRSIRMYVNCVRTLVLSFPALNCVVSCTGVGDLHWYDNPLRCAIIFFWFCVFYAILHLICDPRTFVFCLSEFCMQRSGYAVLCRIATCAC